MMKNNQSLKKMRLQGKLSRAILISLGFLGFAIQSNGQNVNTATLDATQAKYRISKYIYGHFTEHLGHCIYGGIWVGENSTIPNVNGIRTDVAEALKRINVPIIRWPGGCFADEYHWKDGIGPRNQRPSMINTNWGGVTEDNSFGTHEFMEFCRQVGAEAYISGNLGSGTVQEMSQWVEYLNSDNISPMTELRKKNGREKSWGVKFWGIGNESWGCGGNMRPEYYADIANQYATFLKNYGSNTLNKIAVGPSDNNYYWTDVIMKQMGTSIWGLSLHSYTWGQNETATDFNEAKWFGMLQRTLRMEEYVTKHSEIMDKYDPSKNIALVVDEWGAWYNVEPGTNPGFLYQQNTLRDAVIAGTNLNIFNNHCDRVKMAAVAQLVNVLQSLILTDNEKMVLTPTYYVFDLYKVHQNALMIPVDLKSNNYQYENSSIPALNMSASIDSKGLLHITICNTDAKSNQPLECNLKGYNAKTVKGKIITASHLNAHNTFDKKDEVKINDFSECQVKQGKIISTIPAHSVVLLEIDGNFEGKKAIVSPKDLKQGLSYKVYEGQWNRLPDFTTLTPKNTGTIKSLSLPADIPSTNTGIVYEGFIKIDQEGFYEFSLTSDDGSKMEIDGETVVVNDGLHGMIERTGSLYLQKGYHSIRVEFFQAGGGFGFNATMSKSGETKVPIDENILFHQ
jgi:alpha-N-arabinofuranosidase